MKVKLFTITRRNWERAKEYAEDCIREIPWENNRKRVHEYSMALARRIVRDSRLHVVEPVGKNAIWDHEVQIGRSGRFADHYRAFDEVTIEKQSGKGDSFVHSGADGYTKNVTIIWH